MENNRIIEEQDSSKTLSQPLTLVAAFVIVALAIGAIMFGVFVYLK